MGNGSVLVEAWVVGHEVLGSPERHLSASDTSSSCHHVLVHVRPGVNHIVELPQLLEALLSRHE